MITEEEIRSGSISPFEHMLPESKKITLISLMRLLDLIPIMEQRLVDAYIERLEDKGIFKQLIKSKLNDISSRLERVNREVYKIMDRSGEDTPESRMNWYDGSDAIAQKFANSLLAYVERLEGLTNVSNALTPIEKDDLVISKSQFLFNLKNGDVFMFLDTPSGLEYTFDSLKTNDNGYYCTIKRINDKGLNVAEFNEDRLLRPVINMNLLTDQDLIELNHLISKRLTVD